MSVIGPFTTSFAIQLSSTKVGSQSERGAWTRASTDSGEASLPLGVAYRWITKNQLIMAGSSIVKHSTDDAAYFIALYQNCEI